MRTVLFAIRSILVNHSRNMTVAASVAEKKAVGELAPFHRTELSGCRNQCAIFAR